jgi:CheY-like chemotaxis protein
MAVLLVSRDLMGASRVEGAARLAGVEFRMVGSVDDAIEFCATTPVSLVMVDLTLAGLDVAVLVERLKCRETITTTIVAYGPHVHEAALEAAKSAGCDQVLSRGQFISQVDAIIAHFAAAAPKDID